MNKNSVALILIVVLAAIIISPFMFIWSLNTLFSLTIAFGFYEWLAALILIGTLTGNGVKFKKE